MGAGGGLEIDQVPCALHDTLSPLKGKNSLCTKMISTLLMTFNLLKDDEINE